MEYKSYWGIGFRGDNLLLICSLVELVDCGLTAVKEEFRGNGIASLVKEKTIDYAKKQALKS
jgi:GNAT superfamily N-acetyltransferase